MTRRTVFACFIVRRLLLMAGLDNTPLFVGAACGCFRVFAVVYVVVYRVTSNAYYRLVSAGTEFVCIIKPGQPSMWVAARFYSMEPLER